MPRKGEYRNTEGAVHGQPPPMLKEVRKDDMADIVNHITFGTDDASLAAFLFMLHEVRAEGQPLGSIDFNKLIPMPQELDMRAGFVTHLGLKQYMAFVAESAAVAKATMFTPEAECTPIVAGHLAKWDAVEKKDPEAWALGEKAFQNIKKYGCPTWVEWTGLNWGTRDNAFNCSALDSTSDTMVFQTTSTAVPKIVAALSKKHPAQEITYSWADGDTRQHLGRMVFKGGEAVEVDIPQEPAALAQAMSAGIWRFQAEVECPASPVRNSQKKTDHRRIER